MRIQTEMLREKGRIAMKRIILISVTGAILIGCVIAQSLAEQSAAGNVSLSLSDKLPDSEKRFVMGEDKGRVVVYRAGESEPFMTTDTFTYSLPKADKQKLEQGIIIEGEAALRRTLEDYCS